MMDTHKLTIERGKQYGHPIDHFPATRRMYDVWHRKFSNNQSPLDENRKLAIEHGVYMIVDKLIRAADSPDLRDHWDDVAGYARTVLMALGEEKDDEPTA